MTTASMNEEKIRAAFRIADVNNDGVISRADVEAIARQAPTVFNLDPDDKRATNYVTAVTSVVEKALAHADADADGVVTPEEYSAYAQSGAKDFEADLVRIADAFTDCADTNRDGKVDRAEIERWIEVVGGGQAYQGILDQLDAGGNGFLTRDQVREFCLHMFR